MPLHQSTELFYTPQIPISRDPKRASELVETIIVCIRHVCVKLLQVR